MSLTKAQKKLLKKIDAGYARMEKLTRLNGFPVTEDLAFGFQFPNNANLEKQKAGEQNKKRKLVFENTRQQKERAF